MNSLKKAGIATKLGHVNCNRILLQAMVLSHKQCQDPDFRESFRCSASQRCSHSDFVAGKKSAIRGQTGPGQI